jgi:hypothetical protein
LLAHVEHLHLAGARVQTSHVKALDRLGWALLLAPARHPAPPVSAELTNPDRGGQVSGAQGVSVIAPDQDDVLVAIDDPRKLRAEPSAIDGLHRAPGMCASSY